MTLRALAMFACFWSAFATMAEAQEQTSAYPSRPVRLIVPASAGGPTDVIARLLGKQLSTVLGQQIVVENRPGASQMLGTNHVATSKPDGYTLLFAPSTPIVIIPLTTKDVPYDVRRDFRIVSHVGTTPLMLYANVSTPAGSVAELVASAKARPNGLNYGTWGNRSSGHLLVQYMSMQAGISLVHVPYAGMGPAITDLVAGHVQLGVADVGTAHPFVQDGKLKPIAVAGSARVAMHPNTPTFAEQGIQGMEPFSPWFAVMAPIGTPEPIVRRLSDEAVRILKSSEMIERLTALGVHVTALPADEAGRFLRAELALWSKIVGELPDMGFN